MNLDLRRGLLLLLSSPTGAEEERDNSLHLGLALSANPTQEELSPLFYGGQHQNVATLSGRRAGFPSIDIMLCEG